MGYFFLKLLRTQELQDVFSLKMTAVKTTCPNNIKKLPLEIIYFLLQPIFYMFNRYIGTSNFQIRYIII